MKRSHILVFVTLGCVLFYRGGQVAWHWAEHKALFSDDKRYELPFGYEFIYHPRKGFLTIPGAFFVPGPGCYFVLVGRNCFRDNAVIGFGAVLLSSAALFVGWRRRSWKISTAGLCLAIVYGIYFRPWLAFERMSFAGLERMRVADPKWFSEYYWQIVPWLWLMRCVAVAWVIGMLLAGLSISILTFRHRLSRGGETIA